jgi:hypothetical protein
MFANVLCTELLREMQLDCGGLLLKLRNVVEVLQRDGKAICATAKVLCPRRRAFLLDHVLLFIQEGLKGSGSSRGLACVQPESDDEVNDNVFGG